jgi:hypothetical protein
MDHWTPSLDNAFFIKACKFKSVFGIVYTDGLKIVKISLWLWCALFLVQQKIPLEQMQRVQMKFYRQVTNNPFLAMGVVMVIVVGAVSDVW